MELETTGIVVAVFRMIWVNNNYLFQRVHGVDNWHGGYSIRVKYVVNGKKYIYKKLIKKDQKVPWENTVVKVFYNEKKPSKARIEF